MQKISQLFKSALSHWKGNSVLIPGPVFGLWVVPGLLFCLPLSVTLNQLEKSIGKQTDCTQLSRTDDPNGTASIYTHQTLQTLVALERNSHGCSIYWMFWRGSIHVNGYNSWLELNSLTSSLFYHGKWKFSYWNVNLLFAENLRRGIFHSFGPKDIEGKSQAHFNFRSFQDPYCHYTDQLLHGVMKWAPWHAVVFSRLRSNHTYTVFRNVSWGNDNWRTNAVVWVIHLTLESDGSKNAIVYATACYKVTCIVCKV